MVVKQAIAEKWTRDSAELSDDGILQVSEERRYNIDEESYDERYKRGLNVEQVTRVGAAFARFAKEYGIPSSGPMLELGCGTGRLTGQILAANYFDECLITDGSNAFVRITKRNMETLAANGLESQTHFDYACLVDSDFAALRDDHYAAVSMFGVLHHFLDWKAALAELRPKLMPGGCIFFSEPAFDFMTIAGLMSETFEFFAEERGIELQPRDMRSLRAMKNAAAIRCAYDPDIKAKHEDKHAFRLDDLHMAGRELGFDVVSLPNGSFGDPLGRGKDFGKVARHRFAVVNNFSDELMAEMGPLMDRMIAYLDRIGSTGAGPYFDCLYVLKKQ